ncbi:MAG: Smr/MutS family protein [Spirochaetaceae bacterium]|nr:Smr/MutS family protein [Spirochaetaceae bacterium]
MNFGDILDDWENATEKNPRKKRDHRVSGEKRESISMEALLNTYAPDLEILETKEEKKTYIPNVSREKMRRKKADMVLDLHGMTGDEARIELNNFIRRSYTCGAKKILIIHGKGNHTRGEAVLKPLVKSVLDLSPYIGDIGVPEKRDGGSGATWAVVRQRSL